MAKYGVSLRDGAGALLFPRTVLEQVYSKNGTNRLDNILRLLQANIESDIEDTNLAVAQLREELDAFLSDAIVSGEVRDAILEIKALLDSNSSDVVGELVATMSALRDEAVRNVAQTMTETQKSTARTNIGAVGVSATYGDGLATISYNGNAIFPETKGTQVKLSKGGNAEDAIKANGESIAQEKNRAIAREDEIAETLAETKENVDVFLADADTSEQAINKLKELQEYIKNDETAGAQMLGDIAQNKQDIADNTTNIEKEVTRAKQTEMYLESQKADKSGYYENLSVGIADNLSGRGEATESEFAMRPSGGENKSIPEDGTARINTIKGNSVVWNQLCTNKWRTKSGAGAVTTNEDGTITFTSNGDEYTCMDSNISTNDNDLYYIRLIVLDKDDVGVVYIYDFNHNRYKKDGNYLILEHITTRYEQGSNSLLRVAIKSGNAGKSVKLIEARATNLTKMFNGVNVPTTVEEFEAFYGNMPNEYNEGTIIDNHTSAIKSVGVNAWDEEWEVGGLQLDTGKEFVADRIRSKNYCKCIPNAKYYVKTPSEILIFVYDIDKQFVKYLYCSSSKEFVTPTNAHYFRICLYSAYGTTYNHDICIHLVHTGYLNGKYFTYESQTRQLPTVEGGLKSAGTAYDEIRYNKGKDKWEHVKRIGSVDLGTLSWYKTTNCFGSSSIMNAVQPPSSNNYTARILCAKYNAFWQSAIFNGEQIGVSIGVDKNIFIRDTAYTDVASFKQAMQGVILNYELAEPVVTELDVDISPDYKVWDYGTEEAISEVLSTPIKINSNYGFNAVGQITDNTMLIQELLARVAVLEAQVAQANSTNAEDVEPVVE